MTEPQISQIAQMKVAVPGPERDQQTHAIIGAAMEVHRELGSGFLEQVYHEGLKVEFGQRSVPFLHEVAIPISYKGLLLNCSYRADFVCFDTVLVELKAISSLTNVEQAQIIHYLKATGLGRGLLINSERQACSGDGRSYDPI